MLLKKILVGIAGEPIVSDNKKIGHFMFGAGAVIEHPTENKILITKRANTTHANGSWELVYGRVDNHEELEAGLKREVFEETGLTNIKIKKVLRLWHFYRGDKTADKEIYGVTFICQAKNDQVILNKEHTEYQWVTPEEAVNIINVKGINTDVKLYLDYLKNQNLKINLSNTQEAITTY